MHSLSLPHRRLDLSLGFVRGGREFSVDAPGGVASTRRRWPETLVSTRIGRFCIVFHVRRQPS
jgi:hypothetical protein